MLSYGRYTLPHFYEFSTFCTYSLKETSKEALGHVNKAVGLKCFRTKVLTNILKQNRSKISYFQKAVRPKHFPVSVLLPGVRTRVLIHLLYSSGCIEIWLPEMFFLERE